ncbi:ArsR/SmtB family transcription factor [Halomonas sp. I5-271120]|uniref:ArsR/SmtB family transcription factor n=1 Tax=Halomonas sp. I5-271120 TaxID=3061632 RepID=UPI00350E50FB
MAFLVLIYRFASIGKKCRGDNVLYRKPRAGWVVLKALAHEVRLNVLLLLKERGEMKVMNLNKEIPEMSQSSLSQHLTRLRSNSGLVTIHRRSTEIFYSAIYFDLRGILAQIPYIR